MLTFGLVVEGVYDVSALTEFIKKCVGDNTQVVPRPCGSKSTLMKHFPEFLEGFRHDNAGGPVDKALVIRDADNRNPTTLITTMRDRYRDRHYLFPVESLVIAQMLEAWLLADHNALSVVCNQGVPAIQESIEDIFDPKTRLKQILSMYNVQYTPKIAGEIAANTDLDMIGYRCPMFRHFRQYVSQ
jgi:hypothetical protein